MIYMVLKFLRSKINNHRNCLKCTSNKSLFRNTWLLKYYTVANQIGETHLLCNSHAWRFSNVVSRNKKESIFQLSLQGHWGPRRLLAIFQCSVTVESHLLFRESTENQLNEIYRVYVSSTKRRNNTGKISLVLSGTSMVRPSKALVYPRMVGNWQNQTNKD